MRCRGLVYGSGVALDLQCTAAKAPGASTLRRLPCYALSRCLPLHPTPRSLALSIFNTLTISVSLTLSLTHTLFRALPLSLVFFACMSFPLSLPLASPRALHPPRCLSLSPHACLSHPLPLASPRAVLPNAAPTPHPPTPFLQSPPPVPHAPCSTPLVTRRGTPMSGASSLPPLPLYALSLIHTLTIYYLSVSLSLTHTLAP